MNYKAILQYDGTRYRGWQVQGNTDNTIQGKIETLLTRMAGEPVEVNGSGRTDAGVHAAGQVISFRCQTDRTPEDICAYMNQYLPEDICVLSVEEAAPRFHARLNAVRKTYVYRIWNAPVRPVFERKYMTWIEQPLDVDAMRRAAELLCGTHDYRAFCSLKKFKKSTVRTVEEVNIEHLGKEIRISYTGGWVPLSYGPYPDRNVGGSGRRGTKSGRYAHNSHEHGSRQCWKTHAAGRTYAGMRGV